MTQIGRMIYEDGVKEGRVAGVAEIILKMHKNGFTAEQIANATDKEVEEIKKYHREQGAYPGIERNIAQAQNGWN